MTTTAGNRVYSIGNAVFFIATVVVNALANALPIGGMSTGELSDSIPNLFVPAGITFSIWGVIYLLLLAFAIYQLKKPAVAERIGPLFMISSAANILWILTWHNSYVGMSMVCMLVLLLSLTAIYLRLGTGRTPCGSGERYFVRLPFSVYLGWITVATVANVTAFGVVRGWNGFGLSHEFWTAAVIIVAGCITAAMLFDRKDIGYALVILWAFVGIIIKRTGEGAVLTTYVVPVTIIVMGVIVAAGIVSLLIRRARRNV